MKNGGNPQKANHSKFPFIPTPALPGSGYVGLISARKIGAPLFRKSVQSYLICLEIVYKKYRKFGNMLKISELNDEFCYIEKVFFEMELDDDFRQINNAGYTTVDD